ncbi:uncharacterized protein LOC104865321 [Fukomys damarensis]|uniref:uncharacterized protein LOC104865321 n=1 Tax=Fukomys damarensis TaxID=885580 RepID=UPI0005400FAC|nr:uncharacterized protein LOC104865321 [Fukomys damarensis]XP_010627088.1 uncharacterized protein LOC104865321 [Fukomys damarensis]
MRLLFSARLWAPEMTHLRGAALGGLLSLPACSLHHTCSQVSPGDTPGCTGATGGGEDGVRCSARGRWFQNQDLSKRGPRPAWEPKHCTGRQLPALPSMTEAASRHPGQPCLAARGGELRDRRLLRFPLHLWEVRGLAQRPPLVGTLSLVAAERRMALPRGCGQRRAVEGLHTWTVYCSLDSKHALTAVCGRVDSRACEGWTMTQRIPITKSSFILELRKIWRLVLSSAPFFCRRVSMRVFWTLCDFSAQTSPFFRSPGCLLHKTGIDPGSQARTTASRGSDSGMWGLFHISIGQAGRGDTCAAARGCLLKIFQSHRRRCSRTPGAL